MYAVGDLDIFLASSLKIMLLYNYLAHLWYYDTYIASHICEVGGHSTLVSFSERLKYIKMLL